MTALARKVADPIELLYDQGAEQAQLLLVMQPRYAAMLAAVHAVVASAFPEVEGFRLRDSDTERLLLEAAERVVRIDETTRAAIAEQLRIGQERGYSNWQIAHGVPEDGYRGVDGLYKETWKGRAETISRTELQTAQVRSAQDRYRATGLVDEVEIVDGDFDDACMARNGQRVPVTSRVELLHPRCTLNVIPLVRGQ